MQFRFPLLLALLLLVAGTAQSQSGKLSRSQARQMAAAEEDLAALVETMYTDSSAEARFAACRDLIRDLVTTLNRPNSFRYEFTKLRGLSIQYPPDRSFRLFTWELHVDRDNYRHYGAIQRNSKQLELIPLVDRGDDLMTNPETTTLTAGQWLGYAAYNIVAGGTHRGRPYYLVFGYDSYESYRRRKVLDVLTFDQNDQPVFGLPVFVTYNETGLLIPDRTRIVLEYGAEAVVALRFDPDLEAIVYENLILMPGQHDEGPVYMPDGSYHSLRPDPEGLWREEERVFNHIYKKAPREAGKPAGGRDLMGRTREGGDGGRQ